MRGTHLCASAPSCWPYKIYHLAICNLIFYILGEAFPNLQSTPLLTSTIRCYLLYALIRHLAKQDLVYFLQLTLSFNSELAGLACFALKTLHKRRFTGVDFPPIPLGSRSYHCKPSLHITLCHCVILLMAVVDKSSCLAVYSLPNPLLEFCSLLFEKET